MRILVTGASGRIGSRVVPELVKHGHVVRALDRCPPPPDVRAMAEEIWQTRKAPPP